MSRAAEPARAFARQPWHFAALAVALLTLVVVAGRPAGADSGSLLVSSSADRSGAVPLEGATIFGTAYVFLSTGDDVQRAVFSLDGSERKVENFEPFDFAGGKVEAANGWATSSAGDGPHSIAAVVALVGGGGFTVSASFTVENDPAPTASTDRSAAAPLEGQSLSGDAHVFLAIDAKASAVEFALDGSPYRTEHASPYDFAGTLPGGAAHTWSTASVADGSHTIRAHVAVAGGSDLAISATFTVVNDAADEGGDESESSPTAIPSPGSTNANGSLLVSNSASRGGASALGSEALSGDVFVFLTSDAQLSEVRFHLDGQFVRTEKLTPYDFGGTTQSGAANRWDTTGFADGNHVIEAFAVTTDGVSFSTRAPFEVDNDPVGAGDSEIEETGTTSLPPSSLRVDLFVSKSSDRSGAVSLGLEPLTGGVYIFAVPSDVPDRVSFYLDPATQSLPLRTERITPYDLAGTLANGTAGRFNPDNVEEGVHSLLVVAEYADGETARNEVSFVVEHPEALPEIAYDLLVSEAADRSGASDLSGANLEGQAYIFVSPADHIEQATFYLDDPARNSADRVDATAPFDLVGGGGSAALPLEIDELGSGDHALTAVLTRSDGTSVDLQVTFSVGSSDLPDGAVLIRTTDHAAQIASQHGAGTTFVFETGLHRGVSISPQSGDVFLGSPGAVLSGAKVLSRWNTGGGFWYVGGQTSQLLGTGGCWFNEDGSRYDACTYPEQLFVDGAPWWQVSSLSQLAFGRWYFDYASDRVYIGGNPAGRSVELSTVANAFKGSASHVTISGLVIEKYANRAQTGAIEGSGGSRWTVSSNVLRLNHGFGLRIGTRMQVLNNNVHHNGQIGIGGIGDYVLVQGNEIAYNNTAGFLVQWEAGGTKFVLTDGLVFRDNWVHHNEGRGFWADIENINMLVVGNLSEYNSYGGIVHEIGYSAEIRDNVSRYNGHGFGAWVWGAQILVQNSSDVVITGNDVTVAASGGGNGITVVNQNRGSGTYGPYVSDRVTVTGNTIRHLSTGGRNGAPSGCNQDNTFNGNTYIAPATWFDVNRFEWCGLVNWDEFRARGQELNGTAVISN